MGVAQKSRARVARISAFGGTCQGAIVARVFEPQPHIHLVLSRSTRGMPGAEVVQRSASPPASFSGLSASCERQLNSNPEASPCCARPLTPFLVGRGNPY